MGQIAEENCGNLVGEADCNAFSLFIQVQYYERLSPLVPLKVPLGSFSNVQTGDCIVTFSRYEIYKIKVRNDIMISFRYTFF